MNTKQELARLLQENDSYLSGNQLASQLGVTRAAVWKCIRQLEKDGYSIEAVKNRGYRLGACNDALDAAALQQALGRNAALFSYEVFDEISSTNSVLKQHAADLPTWHVLLAGRQNAGRGRMGRSFFSPSVSGLYMSVLLRPELPATQATRITTAAAVAACRAIEDCTTAKPQIKWVNDVFVNGRKVCGILTEGSLNLESGGLDWAVMGIGFNVYEPEDGFPNELAQIAGPISQIHEKDLRCRLAAAFLIRFYELCSNLSAPLFAEEYRKRSFLIGRDIDVIRGNLLIPATAMDIDEECRLIVRYRDGHTEALSSGEVSVRPA